jgi:hypothetical protein
MEKEILTEQEVKDYINSEYEYLNLTQKEFDRYVKFILKIDRFKSWNSKLKNAGNAFDFFESKFNQLYDLFLQEGYSKETSLELAKNGVIYADRHNYIVDFNILRVLNCEEQIIRSNVMLYKRVPEKVHAKKCYLMDINDIKNQTPNILLKISDKKFEKKFSVNVIELLKKYPLTDEIKNVWAYLSRLKDNELFDEFNLTREEMAMIYPTSAEEPAVLKTISKLTDEDIKIKYGVTREELLSKHPLNNDTLKALKAIQLSSDRTVKKLFKQPKENILNLRTITTEMIKSANREIKLQRGTYSKEELREKLKCLKKGTN